MADGISYFAQSLRGLGQRLKGIEWPSDDQNQVERQELLLAQSHFNTAYNEWLAANAETRWDRLGESYENFVSGYRDEYGPESQRFSTEATGQSFGAWLDETISAKRVPVATQVAEARTAYRAELFQDNLAQATSTGDIAQVQRVVAAAVSEGTVDEMAYDDIVAGELHKINLNLLHQHIYSIASDPNRGLDAAMAEADRIASSPPTYTAGEDPQGNPISATLSREEILTVRDEVKEEIDNIRREQEYVIKETDRRFDEHANDLYTNASYGSLVSFKRWLEGVNPQTGDPLPDEQNPRTGMTSGTWRTWYSLVNAELEALEREADAARTTAEEEALREARAEFMTELYNVIENDPDKEIPTTLILQGLENGMIDPLSGDARTLLNYADSRNENPVAPAMEAHIADLSKRYNISAATQGRVYEAYLKWWNENARPGAGENGEPLFNIDRADSAEMERVASNLFFATVGPQLEEDVSAAYRIRDDQIEPARNTGRFLQGDRNAIDDAERLLADIQAGRTVGYQAMPEAMQRKLNRLWYGHEQMFRNMTGTESIKTLRFAGNGHPTIVQQDNTGTTRYFRFVVPMDGYDTDAGKLRDRGLWGGDFNEQPQVWDAENKVWRDIEFGAYNRRGDYVNFTIIPDRPGWPQ